VLAHGLCANRMGSSAGREGLRWYARLLRAAGVPLTVRLRAAVGVRHVTGYCDPVAVSQTLDDGDVLSVGGRSWQVLHLPGHSPDLICLYEPSQRVLLGSDHLIKHISSNAIIEPPERGHSERRKPLVEYWDSLRRVEAMEIDRVLSGHGEPILDHRALISKRFSFYSRRLDRLRLLLAEGPQTVWSLVQELFPRLNGIDAFLSVSEVLGHLDVLEERGEVSISRRRGVWYYELH
jgi:glyoxylase-like metal-dependent hydrolase (beta-lactamase superfamily II)